MMPAAIVEPKMSSMPRPGLVPIAIIGPTAANVQPMMTGRRMPKIHRPSVWISVAMPHENRSALIRNAIWSFGSFSAPPTISGTATAPAYMTRTCCRPSVTSLPVGSTSSHGWTVFDCICLTP